MVSTYFNKKLLAWKGAKKTILTATQKLKAIFSFSSFYFKVSLMIYNVNK